MRHCARSGPVGGVLPARRRRRLETRISSVVPAVLVVLLSSCSASIRVDASPGSGPSTTSEPTATATAEPRVELDYDEAIDIYTVDVEAFWADALEEHFGVEFQPVAALHPYSPDDVESLPECDGEVGSTDLYAENAFYCATDDYIAWDEQTLFPHLYETFGDFVLGLVIAHEYGHAVQTRADLFGADILVELQADCFAGAWAGSLLDSDRLGSIGEGDLDSAVAGLLSFADPVDTPVGSPDAHGSGFDRLSAFSQGLSEGVEGCSSYLLEPPELTDLPHGPADSGDLPLDELVPLMVEDLGTLLAAGVGTGEGSSSALPLGPVSVSDNDGAPAACRVESADAGATALGAFYCPGDRTVYLVTEVLAELWADVGDFAPAYAVLHAYAIGAVVDLRAEVGTETAILLADCLVGVWARQWFDNAFGESGDGSLGLSLSPGDLDEGIIGLLTLPASLPSVEADQSPGAFERAENFRDGFFADDFVCGFS